VLHDLFPSIPEKMKRKDLVIPKKKKGMLRSMTKKRERKE
jgi:hypothetical protein